MNTLIILSILIGHLWVDRAQANTVGSGLNTSLAMPKTKQFSKPNNQLSLVPKAAPKAIEKQAVAQTAQSIKLPEKTGAPVAKKAEPLQKLIPLEPSKKIEAPQPEKPASSKEVKPAATPTASEAAQPKPAQPNANAVASSDGKPADAKAKADNLEVTIDTVGIQAGGNWLNKRVWYEHAQDSLQDIAGELSNILAARQQYLTIRDTLDNKIEEAFIELGFDQGKLATMLDTLLQSLKHEQEEQGDLSADERSLRYKIEKQQKDLEQLQLDLESLKNLDDSVDGAVKRVMEQINLAGMYNKEAHSYFDKIPNVHELRAKELYYKIDMLYKDMLAIKAYLTGELSDYLHHVDTSATMHIAKIKSEIAAIQAKGINFKKQLALLEGSDDARDIADRQDISEEHEQENSGFFGGIWNWITSWF